jgi:membrane protease YdiL (CAAX protease family)
MPPADAIVEEPAARRPIAGVAHTVIVIAAIAAWALTGKLSADHWAARAHPNRWPIYLTTLAGEWSMFALVVMGVLRAKVPMSAVTGRPWRSWGGLLLDMAIAAGFWVVGIVVLGVLSRLLRTTGIGADLRVMLPHSLADMVLWVLLSVTAGICEETIFRGYLQHQLIALTHSPLAGILLAAAAFGAAHIYQGARMVALISFYGAMFGALAYWRRSVRPGMIAHAWHDAFTGLVAARALRP